MSSYREMVHSVKKSALRFNSNSDLDSIIEAIGNAQYVLLGEASHGTSEFYTVRTELTKKLIENKGFNFVAVEGDWPSCFKVNQYVKSYKDLSPIEALSAFNRWPTWMWANEEVLELIKWLKNYNDSKTQKVGFYGIDVYSLWESMEEAVAQLNNISSQDASIAKKVFSCFEPFDRRPENYGISAAFYGEDCIDEVVMLLRKIRENKHKYDYIEEGALNLEINSLVTVNAERYYRAMVKGGEEDWNIRDTHMTDVVELIKDNYGQDAKAIIWEHNTHIGDARATDMKEEGLINVGQLLRENHGKEKVFAVGFGTYEGRVIAAQSWGDPLQSMPVPKAIKGSWEDIMHQAGPFDKILIFDEENHHTFSEVIGHRAIGVVYNPENEHLGNYVPSNMPERYDAFIHIDRTQSLKPLVEQVNLM